MDFFAVPKIQTVVLPSELTSGLLTGQQIIDLVQQFVKQQGPDHQFVFRKGWDDAPIFLIGQTSSNPLEAVMIIPGGNNAKEFFRPEHSYDFIRVTGVYQGNKITDETVTTYVKSFATRLQTFIDCST